MINFGSVNAHHGTASDYWHVYWNKSDRANLQYHVDILDDSGVDYTRRIARSISDWDSSQYYINFTLGNIGGYYENSDQYSVIYNE